LAPLGDIICPRCGLVLSANTKSCPECGKELGKPAEGTDAQPVEDHSRRNILTGTISIAALAFGIATFQLGYTALFLAFIVPSIAFALVYVWEKNRGLKPGWEFFALTAVGIYSGATFGFIYVLVPVLVYFFWVRYRLNKALRQPKP
jgi:hypothetical protein